MRPLFSALSIIFVVIGFFMPLVWVLAVVAAVLAIGSAPGALGADDRARTGGISGGAYDDIAVSQELKTCPACLGKVSKYASKCQYCGERLEVISN